jgi:hypothetical protein
MSKFTPGKWHIKTAASGNYFVYPDSACKSGDNIAGISHCNPDSETAKANAAIISAAPDLYSALKDVCQAYSDNIEIMPVFFQTFIDIAESALAKADGK